MLSRTSFRGVIASGLALASGLVGLAPEPVQAQVVIEFVADAPPPLRIETYPRRRYADRDVYLVDGRWYYRRGPRWYYYRDEPPPLRRHRVYVIEPRHRRPRPEYRQPRSRAGYYREYREYREDRHERRRERRHDRRHDKQHDKQHDKHHDDRHDGRRDRR